jgi:mono/diheme cytochrome c family protein
MADGGDPSYSDMPPYGEILTDEEMNAILTFIKNTWGQEEREFQWWITAKGQ